MALSFIDNLSIETRKQNVERDGFNTIAEMKAYSENYLPDVFMAVCYEDGYIHLYNIKNEVDDVTGKWRKYDLAFMPYDDSETELGDKNNLVETCQQAFIAMNKKIEAFKQTLTNAEGLPSAPSVDNGGFVVSSNVQAALNEISGTIRDGVNDKNEPITIYHGGAKVITYDPSTSFANDPSVNTVQLAIDRMMNILASYNNVYRADKINYWKDGIAETEPPISVAKALSELYDECDEIKISNIDLLYEGDTEPTSPYTQLWLDTAGTYERDVRANWEETNQNSLSYIRNKPDMEEMISSAIDDVVNYIPIVSNKEGNLIQQTDSGIYVGVDIATKVSKVAGNSAELLPDGIYVKSATASIDISEEDGNTVELKMDGLYVPSPTVNIKVDPDASNALQPREDGYYVKSIEGAKDVGYTNSVHPDWMNLKNAIDDIAAKVYYEAPKITRFTASTSGGTFEKGTVISAPIDFNWTLNKTGLTVSLTDCTIAEGENTASYTSNITSNKTFTLNVSDGTNSATASIGYNFVYKIYYGCAAEPEAYNEAFVKSLSDSMLHSTGKTSYKFTDSKNDKFIFVAIPTSYGIIKRVNCGGFDTEWVDCGKTTITCAGTEKAEYHIYKMPNNNMNAIVETVTVTIS